MTVTTGAPARARAGDSQSLARGLRLLDIVQTAGRVTVADLVAATGLAPSTAYRLVRQLRDLGYVVEVDGHLLPSRKLAEPQDEHSSWHLVRYAAPVLARMRAFSRLTAVLTVRVHTAALCLDLAEAHSTHLLSFHRGTVRALYAGASATPLLAFAPRPVVDEVLRGPLRGFTGAPPPLPAVREELQRIRRHGFAVSRGALNPAMAAVGLPVILDSRCLCALSLVGEMRELASIDSALDELRLGALELTASLRTHDAAQAWLSAEDWSREETNL